MARQIMQAILLFLLWLIGPGTDTRATVWSVVAFDPKDDGRDAALPDAAQLAYRYEQARDMLWFRVALFNTPAARTFNLKIAVDGAPTEQVVRRDLPLTDDGAIVAGFSRTELTSKKVFKVTAAVGVGKENSDVWSDDVPVTQFSSLLDLAASRPRRGLREIDVSRDNLHFPASQKTLADSEPPRIVERGHGRRTLILIPGVYSGDATFETFMQRNASTYTFLVVTPPGLGATTPRPLPSTATSVGEFPWTRRLARDIRDLIAKRHLDKPVIVAHAFPGSLAAEELAASDPSLVGGIVEIASMPVQFAPSMRTPGREATPDERIAVVDESWLRQWFKYVTPETWESNNYPATMMANDPALAERARRQFELTPLSVKIRYLVEFMAADHRELLGTLRTPLLALIPGFNEALLADPANSFFKSGFQDGWSRVPTHPGLELTTIPDARALVLDDQPALADRAIAAFIAALPPR